MNHFFFFLLYISVQNFDAFGAPLSALLVLQPVFLRDELSLHGHQPVVPWQQLHGLLIAGSYFIDLLSFTFWLWATCAV